MSGPYPSEIEAARLHAPVRDLLTQIELATPVRFVANNENSWGSTTVGGETTIHYATSKRPVEALAHELLHAKLKINGYSQYSIIVPGSDSARPDLVVQLLEAIDNELQHHRMQNEFQSLGLDLKYFYSDADKSTYPKVRRNLEKLTPADSPSNFFLLFLSIIAPGGQGTERERTQLKTFCRIRAGSKIGITLDEIDSLFARWRENDSLDATPTLQEILKLLGVAGPVWIGRSVNFPNDGFFLGNPFELKNAVTPSLRA